MGTKRGRVRMLGAAAILFCLCGVAPAQDISAYTRPQLRPVLQDGRRINLVCSGAGSPTVILTAGLGDWSVAWYRVQPQVAKVTRVCSWDRAGFGFSDPRGQPLDIQLSAHDLADALKAAHIAGPYIAVGHSMGGLETLMFADAHQREVKGILLVDPTIPGQYQIFARIAPRFTDFARAGATEGERVAAACASALRDGAAGNALPRGCPPSVSTLWPAEVIAALTPMQSKPERVLTQASFIATKERSTLLGENPRRRYGETPLIVLSAPADDATVPAGRPVAFSFPPDIDPAVVAEVPAMGRAIAEGQTEITRLSAHARRQAVFGTGHYIQLFRPEVVVSSIDELVKNARGR